MTLATPTIHYGRPSGINQVGTVVATSGLKADEYGMEGPYRTTVFTFTDYSLVIADSAGDNFIGAKIYDFPRGVLSIHGGAFYGTLTQSTDESTGVNKTKTIQLGFGTATAATAVALVLDAACYNILPGNPLVAVPGATALFVPTLPIFTVPNSTGTGLVCPAITAYVSQQTDIVLLTDSSGGTASDTLAAITGSYVEATIENTVATLASKINQLAAAVNARGGSVKTINGAATAADLFINLNVPVDADIDGAATVLVNGTLVLEWSVSGGWAFPAA